MDTGIKKVLDSIEFALSLKSYRICFLRTVDTNENNYLSKYQLNIHQEVYSWYGGVIVIILYMWQSRIEIEYYSVAYFERITEFDALLRWTSAKGGALCKRMNIWCVHVARVWAPPQAEA